MKPIAILQTDLFNNEDSANPNPTGTRGTINSLFGILKETGESYYATGEEAVVLRRHSPTQIEVVIDAGFVWCKWWSKNGVVLIINDTDFRTHHYRSMLHYNGPPYCGENTERHKNCKNKIAHQCELQPQT